MTSFLINPSSEPQTKVSPIELSVDQTALSLPLYISKVQAGFPSPADDFIDATLDLNDYLISNPVATYLVRATGDSMKNAGIYDKDILVVDRSIDPADGKIVIASINGELTVKRLRIRNHQMMLLPENENYKGIEVNPEADVVIWGVVIHAIHSFK